MRGAAVLADNVAKGSSLTKSGPALPHPDSRKGRHIHRTFLRGRTRSEEASGRDLSACGKSMCRDSFTVNEKTLANQRLARVFQ